MTDVLYYTSLEGVEMKILRVTTTSTVAANEYRIPTLPENYKQLATNSADFYRQAFKDSVKPTKGDTSSVRFSNGQYLTCETVSVSGSAGKRIAQFGLKTVNDMPPRSRKTRFVEYFKADLSGAFWDTAELKGLEPTAYLACDQRGDAGCIVAEDPRIFYRFAESQAFNVNDFFSGVTPGPLPTPTPASNGCGLPALGMLGRLKGLPCRLG